MALLFLNFLLFVNVSLLPSSLVVCPVSAVFCLSSSVNVIEGTRLASLQFDFKVVECAYLLLFFFFFFAVYSQ